MEVTVPQVSKKSLKLSILTLIDKLKKWLKYVLKMTEAKPIYERYVEGSPSKFNLPQFPKILYKYRVVNEFTIRILSKREIFFSYPKYFNDPFDTAIPVRFDLLNEKEFDEMSITLLQKISAASKGINLTRKQATEIYYRDAKGNDKFRQYEYREQMMEWQLNHLKTNATIFCLAKHNDNVLMWSHYANQHQGICIGFDRDYIGFNTGASLGKVEYVKKHPVFKPTEKDENFYIGQLLAKAKKWSYEKEFRFIFLEANELFAIQPEGIKEIIFGTRVSEQDKIKIVTLVKQDAALMHVKLFIAEQIPFTFKLSIKPFEP
jgi:hypothetical protein